MRIISEMVLVFLWSTLLFCNQPGKISIDQLTIPDRLGNAMEGSEFAEYISGLSIIDREKAIIKDILAGNVPSFSRKLKPLKLSRKINGKIYELTFYTTCDYLAIGSDKDYLYIPMTPSTAQYLADNLNCSLPTDKMVDIIYTQTEIKLDPQPIPPSEKMVTVPVFKQHTDSIKHQIEQSGIVRFADNLISGHKKDIIISNKIYQPDGTANRVVIYGWHLGENNPIQPVYNGHIASYADYSHGVRLISSSIYINGELFQINEILRDTYLSLLLSNEGIIQITHYPMNKGQ